MGAVTQHNEIAIGQSSSQSSYHAKDATLSQDEKPQQAGNPHSSSSSSSSSTWTVRWDAARQTLNNPKNWGRPDDEAKTSPEQWRMHQHRWRWLNALFPYFGPPMFTMYRIWWPFLAVISMCVTIKLVEGKILWTLDSKNHALELYKASQFMLSLLMAYRVNRTFERWAQARSAFGVINNGLIKALRQLAVYTNEPVVLHQFQKWSMCYVYGVIQLINNTPKVTDPRVAQLLDQQELALYSSSTKAPELCWAMLNGLVSSAGLRELQEDHVHRLLEVVGARLSTVNRIKGQAMPYGMSLFCTGYTFIWLLILPFGIFPEASWWAMVPVSVMALMMLGLEDATAQMEDPFKFIPYEDIAAATAKNLPKTTVELQACLDVVRSRYLPTQVAAADGTHVLPAWPELKRMPQRA